MANTIWRPIKIGAGGWVTGFDISSDGLTRVIRTDTYGAYAWDSVLNAWRQVVTSSTMQPADSTPDGVYEIIVAPNNSQRLYMYFNGYVFRSDNVGHTWTRTAFSQVAAGPNNQPTKLFGKKMAVDPANADVIYVGTPASGVFVSFNAGASFSAVSGIPASDTVSGDGAGNLIAFDTSSGTTGGKTNKIYITSYGHGVYVSTDAGSSFSSSSGAPTTFCTIVCDQNGVVYVADRAGGSTNINKLASGSWSTLGATNRVQAICVNPADATNIICGIDSGDLYITTNAGSTWAGPTFGKATRTASDVPWLAWTDEDYMSCGSMRFDPVASNKLWFTEGIGVWWCNPPTTNATVAWQAQSRGIEQLVGNWVLASPSANPFVLAWDRPVFEVTNAETYPSTHLFNRDQPIQISWDGDYAPLQPSYMAVLCYWNSVINNSYTTDGGVTWTTFSGSPAPLTGKNGGCIAVSTALNTIIVPNNSSYPYYTLDGGATWSKSTFSGGDPFDSGTGETGFGFAYYTPMHVVCADAVTPNVFYVHNYLADAKGGGLWKSTDGGVNFTRIVAGPLYLFSGVNVQLRRVPGNAGHLFFSAGSQGTVISSTSPADAPLRRSTDSGATWSDVSNIREPLAVGFGAVAPGQSYPTVYFVGWLSVSGTWTYGVYRSDDNCSTWVSLGSYPCDSLDRVKCIDGDKSTYGRVYIAFNGSGWVYGKLGYGRLA